MTNIIKAIIAMALLHIAFPAHAQAPAMKMQGMDSGMSLQEQRKLLEFKQEKKLQSHRLIAIPDDMKANDDSQKLLDAFLKSCPDCQDIPEIDGGNTPIITPTPTININDFCSKHAGKFGCPKK